MQKIHDEQNIRILNKNRIANSSIYFTFITYTFIGALHSDKREISNIDPVFI